MKRLCFALGVALVAAVLSASATAATPSLAGVRVSDVLASGSGYVGVSERRNADGSVTDTFQNATGATVTVSGNAGVRVAIGGTRPGAAGASAHSVNVAVSSSIDKSAPGAAAAAAAAYAAGGRSIVRDAIAAGVEPVVAHRIYGPLVATSAPSGPPYMSFCVTFTSSDRHVHASACEVQYQDWVNGGDWYLADEQQASGYSDQADCCWADRLTLLQEWLSYAPSNVLIRWQPNATQYETNSCNTVTVGVTSPQTGTTYNSTNSICASSFGPTQLVINPARFGSVWNGHEPGQYWYEGTAAVDEVHSPPWAMDSITLHLVVGWNTPLCC